MYLVKKKDTSRLYAMKVIRKDIVLEKNTLELIVEESKVLYENNHPFLIHMKYGFQNEERLFFVMDFIQGGELKDYMIKNVRFPEEHVKFYVS